MFIIKYVKNYLVVVLVSMFAIIHVANASPVNINKASSTEIGDALHGIGPVKAEAIFVYCQEYKCSKPSDLLNVKGIGEKTLRRISEDLVFE